MTSCATASPHGSGTRRPAAVGRCPPPVPSMVTSSVCLPRGLLAARKQAASGEANEVGMWDPVRPEHVLAAVQEYDVLGQAAFLHRHGFGVARAYQLIVDGRSYDSKALLGAAYRIATGRAITSSEFSGGVGFNSAASVLQRLGFEIRKTASTEVRSPSPRRMRPAPAGPSLAA